MIDPISLEVMWSRLVAITDEAAATLLHTAFSTVIRESNDYTVVLLDSHGRTIAECQAGIPAFAAVMNTLGSHVLDLFPSEQWEEGDCVITNDPWWATGHLPDVAMISPIFYQDRLVAFSGSAAHVPDIGATSGWGPTSLRSEGLLIPPVRLKRGTLGDTGVLELLLANVRLGDEVRGDLEAQMAAHDVCRRRTIEFLTDSGQADLKAITEAVHARSEAVIRSAITAVPDGKYRSTLDADGVAGAATHIECCVTVAGDSIDIDYSGSSAQVDHFINCTLNYTTAYSIYPLKLLLDPLTRRNHGSYRPITVTAPAGSIVNAAFPAPVLGRHLTGHLLCCAIYRALCPVLPDAVIADSGGAPALRVQFSGRSAGRRDWSLILFASAGMGASSSADGLPTTAFPTNSGAGSVEALEAAAPLLFLRKEFRVDSGGAGTYRGGLGQHIEVLNPTDQPILLALLGERETHPAEGLMGGYPGAPSEARIEGRPVALKSLSPLPPGAKARISFAGGGGFGPPRQRAAVLVDADLREGFITVEAAEQVYAHSPVGLVADGA